MPRIGVAIAVPAPWADDLQEKRRSFGDPAADSIPTHITLLPPTDVDESDLPKIHHHLVSVGFRSAPFRLRLRGTGTFQPVSPVVFVAVSEGISACELLAASVRSGPLTQDLRYHYHPHVTVAQELGPDALREAYDSLRDYECRFTVERFSLFLHGDDGVWRPSEHYPLEV